MTEPACGRADTAGPRRLSLPMIPLEWNRRIAPRLVEQLVRPDLGPCWVWTGSRTREGYGHVSLDGRVVLLHRLAYETHVGPIPDGYLVLHRCDHRPCARWSHLQPGTHIDNMRDMVAKGRSRGAASARGAGRGAA